MLFVDRARATRPDFVLTEENAALVKDICVRLEGLPLAIELAAVRVKLLPLAAIHARLHQRLLLLTGGPRDSPVRHQTLRAAVAWSYGLLDIDEQAVFRALSAFVGGFTLEAAEAVVHQMSPGVRARLLWNAAFVAWRQGDYKAARRLSDESVALCREVGDDRATVMALAVQGQVASHQSRYAAAHASVEQGLQIAQMTDATHGLAWILAVCGVLAYLEGDFTFARSCSGESLRSYRKHLIPMGTTINLETLGSVARRLGDLGLARSLHEESLSISRAIGDRAAIAQSLANLGHVGRALGDMDTARERYTESPLISRKVGDRRGVAITCGNLGVLALRAGDLDSARQWLNESLETARAIGDKRILGAALRHQAGLQAASGEQTAAVAGYTESLRMLEQARDRWGIARLLIECGEVLSTAGRPERAVQLRTIADRLLDSLGARRSPVAPDVLGRTPHTIKKERRWARRAVTSARLDGAEVSRTVTQALALLTREAPGESDGPRPKLRDPIPLSRREREVAALVARGLTNREIAAELVIAERTAGTHVSNLLGKLGAKTRSQIAAWAVERDLRASESA
jgi:non-specific serine/threonine protein kinase